MIAASPQWAYRLSAACFKAALIHLRLRTLEEKFDPRQPRVPAGHPDGGQWTDDPRFGGGAFYRDRLLQQVQNITKYRIDSLEHHEGLGLGHTIELHVKKTDQFLLRRISKPKNVTIIPIGNGRFVKREIYYPIVSTFRNVQEANGFVNAALAARKDAVDRVSNGSRQREAIFMRFGRSTGHGYIRAGIADRATSGAPVRTDMNGVLVVIQYNPSMQYGYHILTAYPVLLP